jgi:hypothetical protein
MKLRIATLGLVLMAALAFPLRSPKGVCTLPACDSVKDYYDDASFTNQVGQYHVSCSGVTRFGHSTYYYDYYENGDCGNGYGSCGGVDYRCENGTITWASNSAYLGHFCPNAPVF